MSWSGFCAHTSVCMFGTEPVLPFAMAELELLGLLGPEPGALLQRDDTGRNMGRSRKSVFQSHPPPKCVSRSACVFSPDISMALFLKVLMTVPSFLRRRGELRLSATFCFNRERTLRFGSETGGGSGEESRERGEMNKGLTVKRAKQSFLCRADGQTSSVT